MLIRVNEAYDSRAKAELMAKRYPIGDRDCHIVIAKMCEEDAMRIYKKPEIWVVNGEWYK